VSGDWTLRTASPGWFYEFFILCHASAYFPPAGLLTGFALCYVGFALHQPTSAHTLMLAIT